MLDATIRLRRSFSLSLSDEVSPRARRRASIIDARSPSAGGIVFGGSTAGGAGGGGTGTLGVSVRGTTNSGFVSRGGALRGRARAVMIARVSGAAGDGGTGWVGRGLGRRVELYLQSINRLRLIGTGRQQRQARQEDPQRRDVDEDRQRERDPDPRDDHDIAAPVIAGVRVIHRSIDLEAEGTTHEDTRKTETVPGQRKGPASLRALCTGCAGGFDKGGEREIVVPPATGCQQLALWHAAIVSAFPRRIRCATKEPRAAASHAALSRHAHASAAERGAASLHAAAEKAAATRARRAPPTSKRAR